MDWELFVKIATKKDYELFMAVLLKCLKEWKEILDKVSWDDETYHSRYDKIIEQRLEEIEPEFLKSLPYDFDKNSRWCA